MNNEIYIIILARISSKRIPKKVLQEIEPGLSLLKHCILTCQKTNYPILVSSDNNKILDIAKDLKVNEVILSPHHQDASTSIDAVIYAIREKNIQSKTIILAQVTNPFFTEKDIFRAYDIHIRDEGSIFAARRADFVYWAWQKSDPIFPTFLEVRSQDLPPVFLPCGAFFIATKQNLINTKSFFKPKAQPYEIESKINIDIDESIDLEIARFLWHQRS